MKPTQFEVFSEQLSNLQKTLDIHIRDSDEEAKDNQQYRLKVLTLEGRVEEFSKQLNKLEHHLQDKMAEVAQPIVAETQDLKDVIKDKKFVAINKEETKKQIKKAWFKFWERR